MKIYNKIEFFNNIKLKKVNFLTILFFLAILYPLAIDIHGSILLWIEIFSPILFFLMLIDLIQKERPSFFKGKLLYYIAILILLIWALISWIKYPLFGSLGQGGAEEDVGFKSYYGIIVGIFIFFMSSWYTYYTPKINIILISKILLYFSLIIGFVRIISFFLSFDIPFFYGVFRYNPGASTRFGGITYRLSGLDIASSCGIFSLLTLRNSNAKPSGLKFIILLSIFLIFLFLHAGRASSIGIIFALICYTLYFEKINIKKILFGFMFMFLLFGAFLFFPKKIYTGQLSRIIAIEGGIQGQYSERRGTIFKAFIKEFYEHPVFGRGIRPITIEQRNSNTRWIQHQVSGGGHGTYHSLLGIFGIGGIFFIFVFLYFPLIESHFILNKKYTANKEIYIFIILFLLFKAVAYYASGKGYNDYSLYMLTGAFVGISTKNYVLFKTKNDYISNSN